MTFFPHQKQKFKSDTWKVEDLNFLFQEVVKGRKVLGPDLSNPNSSPYYYYFNPALNPAHIAQYLPLVLNSLNLSIPINIISNLTFDSYFKGQVVLYPIKPSLNLYWPMTTVLDSYLNSSLTPITILIGSITDRSKVLPLLKSRGFPSEILEDMPFFEWDVGDKSHRDLSDDYLYSLPSVFDFYTL